MASPSTKKRPPLEMEPGEGKAHEMAETPEEEKTEGPEPDDGPKSKSRKRSAKGAKRTKAPMDGEACCSNCAAGKPCKGKAMADGSCGKTMKDGGCGSSMKDCATCTKRGDSLTPQEYLAACDLGIQNRHRCYIRARLDAAERLSQSIPQPAQVAPVQNTRVDFALPRARKAAPAPAPVAPQPPIYAVGFSLDPADLSV